MLANKLRKLERFDEKKTINTPKKTVNQKKNKKDVFTIGIPKTKYIPVQIKQLNKQFDSCYTHTSVK